MDITLRPLPQKDEERFIRRIQAAFQKAVDERYGPSEEPVLPRADVLACFAAEGAETYAILRDGEDVGGAVLAIHPETGRNELQLFFIDIDRHSEGVGTAAWRAIEALHPETVVWETCTPWFERRNLHFYLNKCGFHAVEFFCASHPEPDAPQDAPSEEGFFRFEKRMRPDQPRPAL